MERMIAITKHPAVCVCSERCQAEQRCTPTAHAIQPLNFSHFKFILNWTSAAWAGRGQQRRRCEDPHRQGESVGGAGLAAEYSLSFHCSFLSLDFYFFY